MALGRRCIFSRLSTVCDKYNINRSDVTLIGGGAAVFYYLRTSTSDIDVSLDSDVFDQIIADRQIEPTWIPPLGECPGMWMFTLSNVDFHRSITVTKNYRNHRHFKIQPKIDLLRYKIALGRDKDIPDLYALESVWCILDIFERKALTKILENQHECI